VNVSRDFTEPQEAFSDQTGKTSIPIDGEWATQILSGVMSPLGVLERRLGSPIRLFERIRPILGGGQLRRLESRLVGQSDRGSDARADVLDLTERERAEAAQTRAQAELQQARDALAHRQRVSMLGEVASSLAHVIKQLIAAARIDAKCACARLLMIASTWKGRARPPRDWSKWRRGPTRSSSAPLRCTKKDTTHRERLDVNALIREMALLLQQEASAASISIRTTLAEALPDVMADRVQLQQVFMNLMLNAIEAMKDTGGELTIASRLGGGRRAADVRE
jgi:signal transduction histidine kinase